MRNIFTLICLFFCFSFLQAQIQVAPLESNAILQQRATQEEALRMERFEKDFPNSNNNSNNRVLDCNNTDGIYYSGETIYLVSQDEVELCFNTTEFDTLNDVSVDLSYGATVLVGECITYVADSAVILGLTDTIRVDKCDSLGCISFYYPVVVKRADNVINIDGMELAQEEEITICTPPLELPGEIHGTSFIDCGDEQLGATFNVDFQDNCFVYVASRFAEVDSICFQVCDEYCICDTYNFAFTTTASPADYPFMDDFSYPGPHPTKNKWLDDNVFINSTLAYQAPSVGVATFDGLDETGTPHGGGTGRSDFLTSNYFNLNSGDTDLWLSFWLENKGLTYSSSPGDSMIVEFKNDIGTWIQVFSKDGFDYNLSARPPFEFFKIPLEGDIDNNYLHSNFQFRFVSNGSRNNMQDTWHLDYVVLDQGEPDSSFQDLAFGQLPSDILGRYSSMPWRQFEGFAEQELADTTDYSLINHFTTDVQATNSEVRHIELINETDLNVNFTVENTPTTINPGQRLDASRALPSVSDLATALENGFPGADKVLLERKYTLVPNMTQVGIEDVLRNDTVRSTTVFDYYYAYDDGTAELAGATLSQGHEVMLKFTANVADTLRAVQFHFPRFALESSSVLFNLKVYVGDLDDTPEYERNFVKPFYVDGVLDSLQGFTTYRLIDINGDATPLSLPAGDFYVGWEQASSTDSRVYVGLDVNTNASENIFYNDNVSWYNLSMDETAPMVRPVVSSADTPGETAVKETPLLSDWMHIYPNPVNDQLYFDIKEGLSTDYKINLLTTTGQLVHKGTLSSTSLDVSALPQGMYFVQVIQKATNIALTYRVVVQ